jgi:hypothetical protein
MDSRIRIPTKMSWIRNPGFQVVFNWFCVSCIVLVVLTSKNCLHRIPGHGHHRDIFADQLTGNESGLSRSPPLRVNLHLQGHLVLVLRELLHTL